MLNRALPVRTPASLLRRLACNVERTIVSGFGTRNETKQKSLTYAQSKKGLAGN